jgi:hypothetical protein
MAWPAQENPQLLALSPGNTLSENDLGQASSSQEAVEMLVMLVSSLPVLLYSLRTNRRLLTATFAKLFQSVAPLRASLSETSGNS